MNTANKLTVSTIMHHSVGSINRLWSKNFLTCPYEIFERQLLLLRQKNFNTISLNELYNYRTKGKRLPSNPIVLTFDDGYLDNRVFAYPLLKKYGFKGTIFVNPDCIDTFTTPRENLDDVWSGKCDISDLKPDGFLSWRELEIMARSGVMDVQSHTISHDWYFPGSTIDDFHHLGDEYVWLAWNEKPERRYLYISEDQSQFVPYGYPVYKYGRALGADIIYDLIKLWQKKNLCVSPRFENVALEYDISHTVNDLDRILNSVK